MPDSERQVSVGDRLKSGRRKAVGFSSSGLVKTEYLKPGVTAPLVIRPNTGDVDLEKWISGQRQFIETSLQRHGAILFRGFQVKSVAGFEKCARALSPDLFAGYGDLPPDRGGSDATYESTPYPATQAILFHNEASHMHRWPMKQLFYCVQPAREGGETPTVDCREVYRRLDRKIVDQFSRKQLLYVRNFTGGLDVSWQEFFKATDKAAVEDSCRKSGIGFEWRGENGLRTHQVGPGVARHPQTGEQVFFNQVQLHHISCVSPAVREPMLALFGEEGLPRNVYYGDGAAIEDSVMDEIRNVYWQASVAFAWAAGDILLLDNMLTAHARNPYVGPRRIVVAMAEMTTQGV